MGWIQQAYAARDSASQCGRYSAPAASASRARSTPARFAPGRARTGSTSKTAAGFRLTSLPSTRPPPRTRAQCYRPGRSVGRHDRRPQAAGRLTYEISVAWRAQRRWCHEQGHLAVCRAAVTVHPASNRSPNDNGHFPGAALPCFVLGHLAPACWRQYPVPGYDRYPSGSGGLRRRV
jgi:hypothetical protein